MLSDFLLFKPVCLPIFTRKSANSWSFTWEYCPTVMSILGAMIIYKVSRTKMRRVQMLYCRSVGKWENCGSKTRIPAIYSKVESDNAFQLLLDTLAIDHNFAYEKIMKRGSSYPRRNVVCKCDFEYVLQGTSFPIIGHVLRAIEHCFKQHFFSDGCKNCSRNL